MARALELTIENLRGIRSGTLGPLTAVNILVGRNNSGKSTLVEGLVRLAALRPGSSDRLGRNRLNAVMDRRAEASPWHDEVWHLADLTQKIAVAVKFSEGPESRITIGKGGKVLGDGDNGPPGYLSNLHVVWPEDCRAPLVEKFLWAGILKKRHDKRLVKALRDIFGIDVEGIQLPPDGRAMLLFPEYSLSLDSQGEGARAAFRCLTVLSVMEKTMLVLEEPECHQHPSSLGRFATAVCRQARAQCVQLLITTHSIECVSAFLRAGQESKEAAERESAESKAKIEKGLRAMELGAALGVEAVPLDLLGPEGTMDLEEASENEAIAEEAEEAYGFKEAEAVAVFHISLSDGELRARRLNAADATTLADSGTDVRMLDLYA